MDKPANAGKPWKEEDLLLIGSYAPTWSNACYLGKVLERTPHAVQYMWCKMYSPVNYLKEQAKNDTKSEHWAKILKVRKKLGIAVGK